VRAYCCFRFSAATVLECDVPPEKQLKGDEPSPTTAYSTDRGSMSATDLANFDCPLLAEWTRDILASPRTFL
jgi:hypothetical protein